VKAIWSTRAWTIRPFSDRGLYLTSGFVPAPYRRGENLFFIPKVRPQL
jgi:hypothetical protein